MDNFNYLADTEVLFGKNQIENLPRLLEKYGKNVLLAYGGGSIKRNGIYEKIQELLKDYNITELKGIEPNPKIETVRHGVKLCRDNNVDVILAVGGGSTIDCSKVVSGGVFFDGDPWELVTNPSKIDKTVPIVTVLTLAATGSEMNGNAVISNMDTNQKLGTFSRNFIPRASILDPEYMYTLPNIQTAAGTADIMSHIIESYFSSDKDTFVSNKICEGLLQACIKYCPIALKDPKNYEARANLMWASSLALNGLTACGRENHGWSCHAIEHELSAFYDITHGVGLAILTPRWMKYVLNDNTVDKFVEYGVNVWGLSPEEDKYEIAEAAINKTYDFFKECGIPMTLKEVGIDETHLEKMADDSVLYGNLQRSFMPLNSNDVLNILKMCL